jgi:hypothetical protein
MRPNPVRHASEFVTVGKYLEPTEAQIAKGMLEAAGIECFLQGENANNMLALAFRARLKVRRQDEEAAIDLLESTDPGVRIPPGGFDA